MTRSCRAGSPSPPSSSRSPSRRWRARCACRARRVARSSRTTASGTRTSPSCPSIPVPAATSQRSASRRRSRPTSAPGSGTAARSASPTRSSAAAHAEGLRRLRLRRRERRRALPDPRERPDRRWRAERRRSPRAPRRQGLVHALRAVRRVPARRWLVACGLGRDLEPEVERAPPRRVDLRRRGRAPDPAWARPLRRGRRLARSTHAIRVTVPRTQRAAVWPAAMSRAAGPIRRCRRWGCGCD